MRSRPVLAVALPVGALALAALLCAITDTPSRACARFNHWLVWGGRQPAPLADRASVEFPLEEDGRILVSGTIRYENGRRGAKRQREFPMRLVDVEAGGISVRVEDARRSPIPRAREIARGSETVLVASISGYFDAGAPRAMDYRFYDFRPGEAVELELPFSIDVTPASDEADGGRFSVELGPLEAGGERQWNDYEQHWEPLYQPAPSVRVGVAMVHWREGTRYATVSLNGLDRETAPSLRVPDHDQWQLSLDGDRVICQASATGTAGEGERW